MSHIVYICTVIFEQINDDDDDDEIAYESSKMFQYHKPGSRLFGDEQ